MLFKISGSWFNEPNPQDDQPKQEEMKFNSVLPWGKTGKWGKHDKKYVRNSPVHIGDMEDCNST